VKDAVNVVEQKGGRSVEIRFHCEQLNKENENVRADPCLSRIIYSLLSNAVRYSPATGDHIDFTVTYSSIIADSNDTTVGSKRSRDSPADDANSRTPAPQRTGSYTFCFRNSTETPMDLILVRNYFRYYYHFDALASGKDSVADEKESIGHFLRTTGGSDPSNDFSVGVGGLTRSHVTNSGTYKDLTSTKGLGLGLYTAFNMVKLMGGQLECSAENGTEASFWFTLTLPLSTPQQASSKIAKTLSPILSAPLIKVLPIDIQDNDLNVRQIRVLVVDDSSMCQKVIVKSLKGNEFITDTASNGREACEKLEEMPCKFDVVLMDLRMPVMDGLEAIRYCR
jgi:CheY-like chemotaxis protein